MTSRRACEWPGILVAMVNHLKQVGLASNLHVHDNNDTFPPKVNGTMFGWLGRSGAAGAYFPVWNANGAGTFVYGGPPNPIEFRHTKNNDYHFNAQFADGHAAFVQFRMGVWANSDYTMDRRQ
jgi:hypothetical protein